MNVLGAVATGADSDTDELTGALPTAEERDALSDASVVSKLLALVNCADVVDAEGLAETVTTSVVPLATVCPDTHTFAHADAHVCENAATTAACSACDRSVVLVMLYVNDEAGPETDTEGGDGVGARVGEGVGEGVGAGEGLGVGEGVGGNVAAGVGAGEGRGVGAGLGRGVGAAVAVPGGGTTLADSTQLFETVLKDRPEKVAIPFTADTIVLPPRLQPAPDTVISTLAVEVGSTFFPKSVTANCGWIDHTVP